MHLVNSLMCMGRIQLNFVLVIPRAQIASKIYKRKYYRIVLKRRNFNFKI
jgi:hypothetical protein